MKPSRFGTTFLPVLAPNRPARQGRLRRMHDADDANSQRTCPLLRILFTTCAEACLRASCSHPTGPVRAAFFPSIFPIPYIDARMRHRCRPWGNAAARRKGEWSNPHHCAMRMCPSASRGAKRYGSCVGTHARHFIHGACPPLRRILQLPCTPSQCHRYAHERCTLHCSTGTRRRVFAN